MSSSADDRDRIGEILETVQRIERREIAHLLAEIDRLKELLKEQQIQHSAREAEWRAAMQAKDAVMYELAMKVGSADKMLGLLNQAHQDSPED